MFEPSTEPRSRAWVEVDLDRVRENARSIQRAVGARQALVPMVKANAYGLGVERIVHALTSDPALHLWGLGVAAVAEGEQLRRSGWAGRILVFSPPPPGELGRAAGASLTPCFSDLDSVRRWVSLSGGRSGRLSFHVEIDTGMGRAGFPWSEAAAWAAEVAEIARAGADWEGCFTHYHSADERELDSADEQWERFREALAAVRGFAPPDLLVHTSNSAAALRRGGYEGDLARPGIFLYGGAAGPGTEPSPVVSLRARVALVREVPAGSTVGYGAEYSARSAERWASLAIGYGDGVPRSLWPGRGEVLLHGRRVPVIGRISMDAVTVDVSSIPSVVPGDVATFIGSDGGETITVDEVAERCGTISYEILTGLTPRLPRVYLEEAQPGG